MSPKRSRSHRPRSWPRSCMRIPTVSPASGPSCASWGCRCAMPPEGNLRAAVVQDADSGRVLMLAWMDAEAERRTRESGEAWFWSRSRSEYWHKGASSGNRLEVVELREDCDGDAVLV